MQKENNGYKLRIVAISCYTAGCIGVLLRFYVRKFMVGGLRLDDWLMALGLLFYTVYIIFVFIGLHYGTGQHHRDLAEKNIILAVKYWYFCEWQYVLTTTIIKVAVGFFYLRIMIRRWQIVVVKWAMSAVVIFGVAYFACVVAQCVPVNWIWQRFNTATIHHGSCLPNVVVVWGTYLHSILSASADWTLGLLPVTLLWNAKLGWGTKAMMVLLLALGALASTSTLIRLSVIHNIDKLEDFLWNTLGIAIWSTVEPGVALLAAGLATIRPLLRNLFPGFFSPSQVIQIPSISDGGAPAGTLRSFGLPSTDQIPQDTGLVTYFASDTPPQTTPVPSMMPEMRDSGAPKMSETTSVGMSEIHDVTGTNSSISRCQPSWRLQNKVGVSRIDSQRIANTSMTESSRQSQRSSIGYGDITIIYAESERRGTNVHTVADEEARNRVTMFFDTDRDYTAAEQAENKDGHGDDIA